MKELDIEGLRAYKCWVSYVCVNVDRGVRPGRSEPHKISPKDRNAYEKRE
jgi:hypothetical protein